jgi:hypothetical protein
VSLFFVSLPHFLVILPPSAHPNQEPLKLVLRNWYEMDQAKEFRCFVRNGRLIGEYSGAATPCLGVIFTETQPASLPSLSAVTQRDPSVQASLRPEDEVDLLHDIFYLFHDYVRGRIGLSNCVFSVSSVLHFAALT